MPKPIRVMMLITDLQRGGTPLRTVKLAAALRDHDVLPIVGSLAPRGPLHDELDALGISSFHCDATGPRSVLAFKRLARVIESLDPTFCMRAYSTPTSPRAWSVASIARDRSSRAASPSRSNANGTIGLKDSRRIVRICTSLTLRRCARIC